jgi:Kef-type K+ transport system membrane component KefB
VLTCASIDDLLAWCLLAFVVSIVHSQGALPIIGTIGLTILFIAVMLFGVRPLLSYVAQRIQSESADTISRIPTDGDKSFASVGAHVIAPIIILLLAAYTTNSIGIHPVFGAFLAGVVLPRNVAFTANVRHLDHVNNVLFLPLFFVFSGLQTQIGLIHGWVLWLICLLVLVVACLGKILGGTLSARVVGQSWQEALLVGILMNTRGLVELIVLNIGLQLGVLSPTLFAILVIMAILTTMMASPFSEVINQLSTNGEK